MLRQMIDLSGRDFDFLEKKLRSSESSNTDLQMAVDKFSGEITELRIQLEAKE
jgi:hypothetical protein